MTPELIGNMFLSVAWLSVSLFLVLHLMTRWNATRYGVLTMLTTLAFLAMLTWSNLRPWFGIDVFEHPWIRAVFWVGMAGFFMHRTTILILAQRAGRVYEDMHLKLRGRQDPDPDEVRRPQLDAPRRED